MRNAPTRTERHGGLRFWGALLAGAFLYATALQDGSGQTSPQKPQLPQRIVYWQVFKHVNFLQQQANLADQSGKDGSALRNYYQNRAQLSASETAALNQAAANAAVNVQVIDQQIQAAVAQFRASLTAPSAKNPPAPPAQLATLQGQRDQAILDQVSALQSAMGASRFQQFDNYVQTVFAPHISVTKAPPVSPPSDLSKLPPFPAQ